MVLAVLPTSARRTLTAVVTLPTAVEVVAMSHLLDVYSIGNVLPMHLFAEVPRAPHSTVPVLTCAPLSLTVLLWTTTLRA